MISEKTIYIKRDIYDDNGVLLIAQGSDFVLSEEKRRALARSGKLDLLLASEDVSINSEIDDESSNLNIFDTTSKILQQKMHSFKKNHNGLDFAVVQEATDVINHIVFECKNEDWSRYVSLLYSYVDWLYAHSINTAIISYVVGKKLGYNKKQLTNLCTASLLHDIGVTVLPKEILNKPSKLTDVEYTIMKNHCQMGASMLKECNLDPIVPKIILQHHERLDGSGYPYGLNGNQILEEALIVMEAI